MGSTSVVPRLNDLDGSYVHGMYVLGALSTLSSFPMCSIVASADNFFLFVRDYRSIPIRTNAGYRALWVPTDCLHLAVQYQLSSSLDGSHGSLLSGDHTLLAESQVRGDPDDIC